MSLKDDVKEVFGAVEEKTGGLDRFSGEDTRLDTNSVISRSSPFVISRMYDKKGFPVEYFQGKIYSFKRFTATKIGRIVEFKFYEY